MGRPKFDFHTGDEDLDLKNPPGYGEMIAARERREAQGGGAATVEAMLNDIMAAKDAEAEAQEA